ncbi:hypothetical protein CC1G_02164 [Coprinopsis cinerea okayama7|uniref:Uncharacterized protein n=1 Tax=Coprinopsis cinerea (strain Okayama-7 / 130 / ATCC MYA-4618 / FGSC 9003) TaxID=240176 RepID=A8NKE7_COPC7|nr:hypothetical protein CC1G_02164 [Coprinopsis cinerea okayama7\|eukprot:XP_001834428.2 hypothetical protein CC1G_02164 [Coprinopsis cinerea okayama7\
MPILDSSSNVGISGGNFIDVNGSIYNTEHRTNMNMINSGNTHNVQIKDSFNDYSTNVRGSIESSYDYGRHSSSRSGSRRDYPSHRSSSESDDWDTPGFPFDHVPVPPGYRKPRPPVAAPRSSRYPDQATPFIEDAHNAFAEAMRNVAQAARPPIATHSYSTTTRVRRKNPSSSHSFHYRSASAEPAFGDVYEDDDDPPFPTPQHHSPGYLLPEVHRAPSKRRDRERPRSSHEPYDERSSRQSDIQLRSSTSRHRKHETRSQDRQPARTSHQEPEYHDYDDDEVCPYCNDWRDQCRCYEGQDYQEYSDNRTSRRTSKRKARKVEQYECEEEEVQGYDAYPDPVHLLPEEPARRDRGERSGDKGASQRGSRTSLHREEKDSRRESRTSLLYEEEEYRRVSRTSVPREDKDTRKKASRTSVRDGRHSPAPKPSATPPVRRESTDSALSYVSAPVPKKPEPVPYGKSRIEVLAEHSNKRSDSPSSDTMSTKGSDRTPSIRIRSSSPIEEASGKGKERASRSRRSSPTRSDAGSEAPKVQIRSASPTASETAKDNRIPKGVGSDFEEGSPSPVRSESPEPITEPEGQKVTLTRQSRVPTPVKEARVDKTPKDTPAPLSGGAAGITEELQRVSLNSLPPKASTSSPSLPTQTSSSTSPPGGQKGDYVGDMLVELFVPGKEGEAEVEATLGASLSRASGSNLSLNSDVSDTPSSSGKDKKRNVLKKLFKPNKK